MNSAEPNPVITAAQLGIFIGQPMLFTDLFVSEQKELIGQAGASPAFDTKTPVTLFSVDMLGFDVMLPDAKTVKRFAFEDFKVKCYFDIFSKDYK